MTRKTKVISTVLLCIILFAAAGLALGLLSADRALSESSIKKSMAETEIIEQLVDEAIAENTINMGGAYGEFAKDVFRTEAVESFFVTYLTSAVNARLYGEPYEEVAYDELTSALVQGTEEVKGSGKYNISGLEADMIIQAIKAEAPDLTAAIDEQVNKYETISGSITEEAVQPSELIKKLLSPGVKAVVICVCILLCTGIIAIWWRSRLGFLWCGIVSLAAAIVYGAFSIAGEPVLLNSTEVSPSEQMVVSMITGGFNGAFAAGALVSAIFFVMFGIMRAADRRKTDEQTFEASECTAERNR